MSPQPALCPAAALLHPGTKSSLRRPELCVRLCPCTGQPQRLQLLGNF